MINFVKTHVFLLSCEDTRPRDFNLPTEGNVLSSGMSLHLSGTASCCQPPLVTAARKPSFSSLSAEVQRSQSVLVSGGSSYIYICIKNYIKPCISAQHEAVSPCPLCKRKMLHVVRLWLPQASWKLSVFAPVWWHPSFFSRVGAPLMLTYAPCHSPSLLFSGRVLGKQETFRSH